ncbi:MAG: bifunctional phosphopantothenoylcysteine decarboxylase/phosphopantothenate--cysteine ligase CoaBC [Magnetovibrio sp.]|nr:bifunctional phosphopantothenoylcysteine decarboxylase/phosphopantothenate--cysteine ligase CoaBC [Magnetovibrio sp.]
MLNSKKILLIITGGIAAYKCPDLVRRMRERGANVRCVLTSSAKNFVASMTLSAISEERVYEELYSLTDEHEMGHIQLGRDADIILVAPATANMLTKMACGLADDLASSILLATDKPVFAAPSMNVRMWENPAIQENVELLRKRDIKIIGPEEGDMACHDYGLGRMSEPSEIIAALENFLTVDTPLSGRHALVTSGPTHEPIDPVRYIANRSSGKQGYAIAESLAKLGARTTLVSGPTHLPTPSGVDMVCVESASQMLAACEAALPADIAVFVAAVCDWHVAERAPNKLKKNMQSTPLALQLSENPDILATIGADNINRPKLVVGFAAETENVIENAKEKLTSKGCDWIVANNVSLDCGTLSGDKNTVHLITETKSEEWPTLNKSAVGLRIARRIAKALGNRAKEQSVGI